MANKEKHLAKWQNALTELNLISPEDKVEAYVVAKWAEINLGPIGNWRQGTLIFTKEKLVFMTTFGVSQFAIDYSDVREVSKKLAGLLPMGMQVSAYNKKTDKIKKYKFWLGGRKKWMQLISEKAGLGQ